MLGRWGTGPGASVAKWAELAPWLDRAWDEATLEDSAPTAEGILSTTVVKELPDSIDRQVFISCARAGIDAGMISLAQARAAARETLATQSFPGVGLLPPLYKRDGHTSTVFRAGACAINVSRDTQDAERELIATEAALRGWWGAPDIQVPAVYGIQKVCTRWFDTQLDVAVLTVSWLDRAQELHLVRTHAGPQFVRVDHFISGAAGEFAFAGSPLGTSQSGAVWSAIWVARTASATIHSPSMTMHAPVIQYNDGDVVVCPSGRPGLVGASNEVIIAPIATWPYIVALDTAPDDLTNHGGTLWWNDPRAAVTAVCQGFRRRGMPGREIREIMEAAAKMPTCDVQARLRTPPDPIAANLIERTRQVCAMTAGTEDFSHASS